MESDSKQTTSRIINLLEANKKVILSLLFLISLVLTLSPSRRIDTYSLFESAINLWTNAIRTIGDTYLASFFELADIGITRFILFFQAMYDFYFQSLLGLDFDIFRQTGYILALIYFVTPLIILYSCFKIFSYLSSGSIKSLLTPRRLAIALLVIPFSTDFTWLGAAILILILLFWLYSDIQEELVSRKGTTLSEVFPWKKTVFVLISVIVLFCSVIDSNYTNIIANMVNLEPTLIMLALIVGLLGISILWIIVFASVTQSDVLTVFKERVQVNFTFKNILLMFLLIIIVLPLLDAIVIQGLISRLAFIIINLPWLIALIIFEPFKFIDNMVIALRDSFDVFLDAVRQIFRGIIPVSPTDESIVRIIQPALVITLLVFVIILILYTLFLYVYDSRNKLGTTADRIVEYKLYIQVIVIGAILAAITLYLNPDTFQDLYGDPYQLNWKQDPILRFVFPAFPLFLIGIVIALIVVAIVWGVAQVRKGRSWRIISSTLLINALAVSIAVVMIVPFIWMLKNSFQTEGQNRVDFLSQGLLPDPFTTQNYAQIFGLVRTDYTTPDTYQVGTWLFNSIVAAGLVTVFLVIFSAMAGYVLAKREFVGRRLLFTLTIAIQMVPPYVQVIPLYLELDRMGFVGSLMGVVLPFLIQPFSIFLCTEFMRGIPDDYLDAARIDGYSEFQIFRKIVLPLSIPVLSVMFIINIIGNWNSFMWPLLLLENSSNYLLLRTLPIGMYRINSELLEQVGVVLALATVIVVPIFVILFLAQDYIKRGVSVEGLKG